MTHTVAAKENLYRIGLKYGYSAEEIRIHNNLPDYTIRVGQIINIPDKVDAIPVELKPSDLCIVDGPVSLRVMDALIKYHYLPIREVMRKSGLTIWASLKSGYRPAEYEIKTGRGGGSQHTFEEESKYGIGAVDWTTEPQYLDLLQAMLISSTNYRRIARYKTFIHCDYKDIDGTRRLYMSESNSEWTFVKSL